MKIKTLLLFAIFMAFSIPLRSEVTEIKLWENSAPSKNGYETRSEEVHGSQTCFVSDPKLIVYPAKKPNGIIVIACPGGGYYGLCMGKEGSDMAQWLNAQGITLAVLKYRMPNGNTEVPLDDARQAIKIMRQRASEWGGKPDKVGIMGFSAGGHLAASLATLYTGKEDRPDFQVLFYPVISMEKGVTHQGSRDCLLGKNPTEEMVKKYSLANNVNENTPQAFIILSGNDTVVPIKNSMDYYKALRENNIEATMLIYPSGGHGWGFNDSFPFKRSWTGDMEIFFRDLLKK